MDTQTARTRLEQLLADLDRSARTLQGEDAGETVELAHYDQHPADSATQMSDADREQAAIEVVLAQREEVRAALRRLESGAYGRCVDCGDPLPDERLEARPEAARCVRCQQRREGAR